MNNCLTYEHFSFVNDEYLSQETLIKTIGSKRHVLFFFHPDLDFVDSDNTCLTPILGIDDADTERLIKLKGPNIVGKGRPAKYIPIHKLIENTENLQNAFIKKSDVKSSNYMKSRETQICIALIPMFNRSDLVIKCINKIKDCNYLARIIVLDDCSKAEEFDKVQNYVTHNDIENVTLRKNPRNLGFAKSVNRFLLNSDCHLCFIINSDTLPSARTLSNLLRLKRCHPNVAVLGTLSNEAGPQSIPNSLSTKDTIRNDVCTPENSELFEAAVKFPCDIVPEMAVVPIVHGFFFLVDVNIFSELGGFDVENFEVYGQENDLNLKIWASKYLSAVSLRDYVFHEKGASFSTLNYHEDKSRKLANKNLLEIYGDTVTYATTLLAQNYYFSKVRSEVSDKLVLSSND